MHFYLLHAYCDFIVLNDFMIYKRVRTDLNKRINQSIYKKYHNKAHRVIKSAERKYYQELLFKHKPNVKSKEHDKIGYK